MQAQQGSAELLDSKVTFYGIKRILALGGVLGRGGFMD